MPVPAWEKGGRRTSVWGGTMLGISKRTRDFEKAWTFAKELYTSPTVAEKLYRSNGIVSPAKKMWSSPIYDEPVPYFCGQPAGRLYLNLAKEVPLRTSSPYHMAAIERLQSVMVELQQYATDHRAYEVDQLLPEAHRLLHAAQESLIKTIQQNLVADPPDASAGASAAGGIR
jgi:arabinosaccharide transport system substrate-binding protein